MPLFKQTSNSYFICTEPRTIDAIFARIRNFDGAAPATGPPRYPRTLAGLEVTSVRDLTVGYDSANPPTYKPALPLSSGHMIQFRAESAGERVTLTTRCVWLFMHVRGMLMGVDRTSGTEPKVTEVVFNL